MLHSLKTAAVSVHCVVLCMGSIFVSSFECFGHDPVIVFTPAFAISVPLKQYIVVICFA